MIWRALWFFAKVAVIGALAIFFTQEPGRVSIDWQGWVIDMPFGVFAIGLLFLVLIMIYGERIRHAIFGFPSRWRAQRKAIREMKGYRSLTLGLVAVAAGDADESRRQSRRAKDLLIEAPLTKLLQAQSARLNGQDDAATAYFEEMRKDPEVAFLGIRGLMTQALQAGDEPRALALAEEARALRPNAKWVLIELLDLQIGAGRMDDAMKTLEKAEKLGAMGQSESAPYRLRLSKPKVRALLDEGGRDAALKLAKRALKADDSDEAMIILTAEAFSKTGKAKKAEQLVEEAWQRNPSSALAECYGSLASTTASPISRVKRFERLLHLSPDAPDGHLSLAEAELNADLYAEAKGHLEKARELLGAAVEPSARECRLMARLEEEGNDNMAAAHDWLIQAAKTGEQAESAPVDPTKLPVPVAPRDVAASI